MREFYISETAKNVNLSSVIEGMLVEKLYQLEREKFLNEHDYSTENAELIKIKGQIEVITEILTAHRNYKIEVGFI